MCSRLLVYIPDHLSHNPQDPRNACLTFERALRYHAHMHVVATSASPDGKRKDAGAPSDQAQGVCPPLRDGADGTWFAFKWSSGRKTTVVTSTLARFRVISRQVREVDAQGKPKEQQTLSPNTVHKLIQTGSRRPGLEIFAADSCPTVVCALCPSRTVDQYMNQYGPMRGT